jgi:predicted DNA-binding transcriptional regulator AlpA
MARFLTRLEFSKELGISLSTLYRKAKENEWPFSAYITVGSRKIYPSALLEQIEEKTLKGANHGDPTK